MWWYCGAEIPAGVYRCCAGAADNGAYVNRIGE